MGWFDSCEIWTMGNPFAAYHCIRKKKKKKNGDVSICGENIAPQLLYALFWIRKTQEVEKGPFTMVQKERPIDPH